MPARSDVPVVVQLCRRPAERLELGSSFRHETMPCNRELGHPGSCSAKGRPKISGLPELTLREALTPGGSA